MVDLFFVGDAAPQFNESDHPRDSDGKFSSTGGGGSAGSNPANAITNTKTNLNWQVAKVFKDTGMKKVKGTELPTFISSAGVKIVVHPTPGQKSSSKWSAHKPNGGDPESGFGHQSLAKLINAIAAGEGIQMVEPKKNEPTTSNGWKVEQTQKLNDYGMNAASSGKPNVVKFENTGGYFLFNTIDGNWKSVDHEYGSSKEGNGWSSLLGHLGENGFLASEEEDSDDWTPDPKIETPQPQPAKKEEPKHSSLAKFVESKGYVLLESGKKTDIYSNGNSKIEYDPEHETWIAQSAGHMTKEGTGLSTLQQLMSGQPAIIPPGGKAPWANTSKTIVTQGEKKAAAEAEAKNAEANKWNAEHKKAYQAVMAAAPSPTPTQAKAISKYSGSSYAAMNDALRHNPSMAKSDATIKELDSYLMSASFPVDITLERGVKGEYAKILKSLIYEGGSFIDKGYSSTSGRMGGGWSGLQLKISCKAGAKGASIRAHSQHSSEDEVLLPRNAIFKVVKIENENLVHVEYVGVHGA